MALSHELISQFAKLATSNKKSNNGTTVYGNVGVEDNGDKYVVPDGSNQKIPINSTGDTVISVENGNRVSVLIKDHTAIVTGNISSPSATTGEVNAVVKKVQANEGYFKKLIADDVSLGKLEVAEISVVELLAKEADIDKLITDEATIYDLVADKVDAKVVEANYVKTKDFETETGEIKRLYAQKAEIGQLVTEDATVKEMFAEKAEIGQLVTEDATVKEMFAEKAEIGQLVTENAAVKEMFAEKAEIGQLVTENAAVKEMFAEKAEIENLDTKYADIDFTNLGVAAIESFFTKSGMIENVVIGDATVAGALVGVTIKGDLIEGNTIKADKLVIKDPETGLYYKLNFEAGTFKDGEPVPTDSLHGSVITAYSITAEKVSVQDLVAFDAKIGGFSITGSPDGSGGAIYSGAKGSVNADSIQGIYLDSEGQLALGDESNFLKYYKDENGKYKLEIAADQFKLSSGKTLEESVTDNLEIGARNLIRNSKTMIFADYYFEDRPDVTDAAVLGTAIIGTMILGKET